MSWLKTKLLGTKEKPKKKVTSEDVNDVIQTVKKQQKLLELKNKQNESKINGLNLEIKECLRVKNRKGALTKLKLRKQIEKRAENLENQIFNLEIQIMGLEEAISNSNTLKTMELAKNILKETINEKTLEEAEDIQSELEDMMQLNDDISNVLSQPMGIYNDSFDENELNEELAMIMDEEMDKKYSIASKKKAKEQELNEDEIKNDENMMDLMVDDNNNKNKKNKKKEDSFDEDLKKLEIEMNGSGIDKIINVEIVQSSNYHKINFDQRMPIIASC